MGKLTTFDIILGVLYTTGAVLLLVAAYSLYLKRFKRAKLKAMNAVRLLTSNDNIFKSKTKFLIEAPTPCKVQIDLLDAEEQSIKVLIDKEITTEEFSFDFDPTAFEPGKYYLSLVSDNVKILRGITILKS